ncbi:uncharacterized protein LOC108934146 [Scleropages formosus]|uniref:uncharacterized protein LOC108934146 n=1 Tax=Scleropages formosus TaxID=113540 RepID=UPI000878198D|nr:uncharacterized protein LOC108934146 [Scleropages formosus]
MRVSCSSRDEYSELRWTLENQNLNRNVAYLSSQRDTVILKGNVSGALGCEVRNHVSNSTNTLQIVPCPGIDTAVTLWCNSANGTEVSFTISAAHSRSVPSITRMFFTFSGEDPVLVICNSRADMRYPTVILLILAASGVFIAVALLARTYCLQVRTTRHRSSPSSQQSDEENVPEPVYTQVSVRKKKKSTAIEQAALEEVQYGQVKLSEHDTLSDSLGISVYTVVRQ